MRILFDSKNEKYKTPFGCLRQNEECTLSVYIPANCKALAAWVIIEGEDGFSLCVPFSKSSDCWEYECFKTTFSLFKCGLYFYYFKIQAEDNTFLLFKEGYNQTNINAGEKWQLTCFDKDYNTPVFFKGAVFYQIFPDRFNKAGDCDLSEKLKPFIVHENINDTPVYLPDKNGIIQNNDFYGGNLKGITDKLDYLKKLNIRAIYLNPIFKAYSNHRYDTADYFSVDPMLGTVEDFKNLCKSAHELGIKIILDGVFSHTGSNSIYFDKYNVFGGGAYSNPDSKYREWYQFAIYPEKYNSWWGIDTLPCVNELNRDYMDFIIYNEKSVLAYWFSLGADGFRLDVADELPDEFIKAFTDKAHKLKNDSLIIGEVWEDASNKISYGTRKKYFVNSELDSVTNYPFRNAIIDYVKYSKSAENIAQTVMTICENYPKPVVDCMLNILSTHDTVRIITQLSNDEILSKNEKAEKFLSEDQLVEAIKKLKMAVFLQFVLPGSPCIYYGDEVGTPRI